MKNLLGNEIEKAVDQAFKADGTSVIVVKVPVGAAPIPNPDIDGPENKYRFVRYVEQTENIRIMKPGSIKIPIETSWKGNPLAGDKITSFILYAKRMLLFLI